MQEDNDSKHASKFTPPRKADNFFSNDENCILFQKQK